MDDLTWQLGALSLAGLAFGLMVFQSRLGQRLKARAHREYPEVFRRYGLPAPGVDESGRFRSVVGNVGSRPVLVRSEGAEIEILLEYERAFDPDLETPAPLSEFQGEFGSDVALLSVNSDSIHARLKSVTIRGKTHHRLVPPERLNRMLGALLNLAESLDRMAANAGMERNDWDDDPPWPEEREALGL